MVIFVIKPFPIQERQSKVTTENKSTGLVGREIPQTDSEQLGRLHLRWMVRRDLDDVLTIDRHRPDGVWSRDDFLESLRRRNSVGMVAESQGRVVGFMVYELRKNRILLRNIGTALSVRGRSVGRQMVAKLIGKLKNGGRNRIACEVHERNLAAQLFFRSLGFTADEILRSERSDVQDDLYLMRYRAVGADDDGARKSVRRLGMNRR